MNARDLLVQLGVSHFNSTIIIQYLWMNPATTDPSAPSIALLIQHLQLALANMGADVQPTGTIDDATHAALEQIVPGWMFQPWGVTLDAVVNFRDQGGTFHAPQVVSQPVSMSGMPFGLPDVPGGAFTYLAAGAVAYYLYKKRKRK